MGDFFLINIYKMYQLYRIFRHCHNMSQQAYNNLIPPLCPPRWFPGPMMLNLYWYKYLWLWGIWCIRCSYIRKYPALHHNLLSSSLFHRNSPRCNCIRKYYIVDTRTSWTRTFVSYPIAVFSCVRPCSSTIHIRCAFSRSTYPRTGTRAISHRIVAAIIDSPNVSIRMRCCTIARTATTYFVVSCLESIAGGSVLNFNTLVHGLWTRSRRIIRIKGISWAAVYGSTRGLCCKGCNAIPNW